MKDQIINIRVDKETKEQIKHRAESLDLNVSEYLLCCHNFHSMVGTDIKGYKVEASETGDKIAYAYCNPCETDGKLNLEDLKEKHDISYSSLEIEAVNTLTEVRSIIDSDMEDSVKASVLKKIV